MCLSLTDLRPIALNVLQTQRDVLYEIRVLVVSFIHSDLQFTA
jgi:hypothetical protein